MNGVLYISNHVSDFYKFELQVLWPTSIVSWEYCQVICCVSQLRSTGFMIIIRQIYRIILRRAEYIFGAVGAVRGILKLWVRWTQEGL